MRMFIFMFYWKNLKLSSYHQNQHSPIFIDIDLGGNQIHITRRVPGHLLPLVMLIAKRVRRVELDKYPLVISNDFLKS